MQAVLVLNGETYSTPTYLLDRLKVWGFREGKKRMERKGKEKRKMEEEKDSKDKVR